MGGDRSTGRNRVIRRKIEMDDDRLIELVRRNPTLYRFDADHQSNNSGSSVSRASIWIAIGAELKRHPLFCKKRWGNIRDNYKKAMKKYHWRLAQGHTSVKKYKFFEQLDFLANQFNTDDKRDNSEKYDNSEDDEHQQSHSTSLEVKCEPDIDTEFDDDNNLYGNFNQQNHRYYDDYLDQAGELMSMSNHQHHQQLDHQNEEDTIELESRVSVDIDNEEKEPEVEMGDYQRISSPKIESYLNGTHLGLRRTKKRKREEPAQEEPTAPAEKTKSMSYFVDRFEPDRYGERHPVDAFLSGIAPTLKSLSPYYLSLAKTNIYSIVQEYEMAMIMEERERLGSHRL